MANKDEVAKRPSTAVSHQVGNRLEGLEEVQAHQVKIPPLILRQGTSKDVPREVPLGNYFLRVHGLDMGRRLSVVCVAMFNSRVLFPKGAVRPACSSVDGRFPVAQDGDVTGLSPKDPNGKRWDECGDRTRNPSGCCWFNRWTPNPDAPGKNYVPCAEQINYLALVIPEGKKEGERQLCVLTFKRKSWKAGSNIITTAQTTGGIKALNDLAFEVFSYAEKGQQGEYAVSDVRKLGLAKDLFPETWADANGIRDGWKRLRAELAEQSTATADDDEEGPGATVVDAPSAGATSAKPAAGTPDDLPF